MTNASENPWNTVKHRETFRKNERLCSLRLIDKLFEPGQSRSLAAFPLRLVYRVERENDPSHPALLISVPKRQFKHAVDRNHVKRQIREAYRTHKDLINLTTPAGAVAPSDAPHRQEPSRLYLAFIWLDSKHHPSAEVSAKVCNLLQRMSERMKPYETL